ncbi:MAG: glycosyltransferase family 39 protein [Chloroflexi bacterium]|nr:glycosyltransferase family 39 protein [Chloroflexota bacterium]
MKTSVAQDISNNTTQRTRLQRPLPLIILAAMASAFILTGAVLPLYGLFFHTALLTQLGQWVLLPSHILFPGWALTPTLFSNAEPVPPPLALSWQAVLLLLCGCLLTLLFYLVALRYLPEHINRGYIVYSTLLLGIVCVLIPVVTSQDIFSYIIYARMAIIYHLNPLTTSPMAIQHDPTFVHLYWKDQPSAYGPIWTIITGVLQWLTNGFGTANIVPMVLALRLLGLATHLWSALLVWSIGRHLQRQKGCISSQAQVLATLAFAWNPLLLFEACVNAHNDAYILFFVLLAIWFLVRTTPLTPRAYIFATIMLALATCLKVNIALLIPGLLLFLWTQPRPLRAIGTTLAIYIGTIVALYAPFWQQGAILDILHINPGTYRDINTLPEFLSHFYNSIVQLLGYPAAAEIGSPAETFFHTLSGVIFVAAYAISCWRAIYRQRGIPTPLQLIRWMTLIWFLYCAIGTPWMWPWYTVTFFGLFALLESVDIEEWQKRPLLSFLSLPLAVRLLAFSMLSLYCFYAWGPFATFMPLLPNFRWAFWRGLWAWFIPLLAIQNLLSGNSRRDERGIEKGLTQHEESRQSPNHVV